MTLMIARSFLLALSLALAACAAEAPVTLDGSSQVSYRESLKSVREQLGPTERVKFEAALKVVEADVFASADSRADFATQLRARLAGKTAADVIAEATGMGGKLKDGALDAAFEAKKAVTEGSGVAGAAAGVAGAAIGGAVDEAKAIAGAELDKAKAIVTDPQAAAEDAARQAVRNAAAEAKQ
jgi:hypothetical protein